VDETVAVSGDVVFGDRLVYTGDYSQSPISATIVDEALTTRFAFTYHGKHFRYSTIIYAYSGTENARSDVIEGNASYTNSN